MKVSVVQSLAEVSPEAWDQLAGKHNPFLEHAFLHLLEESGSVGHGTGWEPRHVLAHDEGGILVGAIPLYRKLHSYGEYIFDWAWADASHRAGIAYYPKLVAAVPFTPATGDRILLADSVPGAGVVDALLSKVREVADSTGASSTHVLFCTGQEEAMLSQRGEFLPRLSYQFHWENPGFRDFEDYLSAFRSGPRKQIRKERRGALSHGFALRTLRGTQLNDQQWASLYGFYRSTVGMRGGMAYLTPAFFQGLRERLAHRVVVSFAMKGELPVAAALAFQKGSHLYGRYWGAAADLEFLHFELCYYQLIDFAIDKGLTRFEAGAQGEHKLKRGFLPSATHSVHWIRHPELAAAVADFLPRERAALDEHMAFLTTQGPFPRSRG